MAYRSCKRKRIIFAVLLIIGYTFVIGEKTRARPTNIERAIIAHAINDDTSQNEIAKKVLLTLEKASKDLSRFIKMTDGVYTKQRYTEIKKRIKEASKALADSIPNVIDVDKYLKQEVNELRKIFTDIGGFSNFKIPTAEQVKTAATFIPYTENSNFESFVNNTKSQFFNVWDSSVRTGYMTGQTTQEIVRNVMGSPARDAQVVKTGSLQGLRNSVVANTRTALQSFAIEARNSVYKQNEDLFDGYKWLATLDRRSCLVCGELDGEIFKTLDEIKTMPPMHLNCRCVIVPYFKELDEMKEYRASENGEIKSGVSYEEWFETQNDDVQYDILGKRRYELYKNGDIKSVSEFVNNGVTIPLDKLEENVLEKRFGSEFADIMSDADKEWNTSVNIDDFSDKTIKEIAFEVDIEEKEVTAYAKRAVSVVNNYLASPDTEIVHFDNSDNILSDSFLSEPRLKTIFETNTSLAGYNEPWYIRNRKDKEKSLLPRYDELTDKLKPIYCKAQKKALIFDIPDNEYGDIGLVLNKEKIAKRYSYTMGDSLNHSRSVAFQNDFSSAFRKNVPTQLSVFGNLFLDGTEVVDMFDYIECQVWGGVDLRKGDVKAFVIMKDKLDKFADNVKNNLQLLSKKYNIDIIIKED